MKNRNCVNRLTPHPWLAVPLIVLILIPLIINGNTVQSSSGAGIIRSPDEMLGPAYGPGSVPVIPQTFDLIAVRGDEPTDIAISPDGGRAYVPGRNTDNLFVIDLATNQIVEVIDLYPEADHPLGPAPEHLAITPDGGRLLVTNANDDSLTVIDTATNTVIKTLPIGGTPTDVAVSPDGSLAYVSHHSPDTIVKVIDVAAAEVLTTISVVPDAGGPFAVAFAPNGSRAYVAMQSGSVTIIDPTTHMFVGNITVPPAGWTGDLVISADGNTGYLNSVDDDIVIVVDLVNNQLAVTYMVVNPIGLALNADGSRLYVGTFGFMGESEYNLWMFDTQSGEVVAGVTFIHPAPYGRVGSDIEGLALTPDGSTLYAASVDGDAVFVVDAATLEPIGMIPTQALASFFPLRAVISLDGAYLYVASGIREPTAVSVIDTRTLEVVGEIVSDRGGPCAQRSFGLDMSPDGTILYALSSGDCVLVIDTQSQAIVDDFAVGASELPLRHIAVHPDGDRAYVLDTGGNVFVVDLESHSVLSTLTTVEDAFTIKLSPDGTRGYIGGGPGYAILDLTTDTLLGTVDFGKHGAFGWINRRTLDVKPDSSQYLVGEFFNMHVYDAVSDEEIRNIDLREWNPYRTASTDMIFSLDGSTGYLAMWDEKAVIAFDANTWQVTAKIDIGRAPYFGVCPAWFALSPDGSTLYAVAEESDNVVVIDTATNTVVKTIRVGKPYHINLPVVLKNYVPPSIIAGTVTDESGNPIAEMTVGAGDYDSVVKGGPGEFWMDTATDGTYRLDVPSGTYLVFVNSHHQPSSYIPEAYPNVNSWSQIAAATRVTVAVGQSVTSVDFSLPAGFTVSGRLVDHQAQPVLGAGGHIEDPVQGIEFGHVLGFGSSHIDGTFQVNVPAGTYDLGFCKDGECHVVLRDIVVSDHLDLGDVLFAEAP